MRCGQGHPSLFDIDKRSLEETHGVLEGYLREGRRPGAPVLHLRTEAPQPVPPPFHQDIFLAPSLIGGHEGQNTRWGSPGPEGSLICKQNTKGKKGPSNKSPVRRAWQALGRLEEPGKAAWRSGVGRRLEGKVQDVSTGKIVPVPWGESWGLTGRNRNTRTKFGVTAQGAYYVPALCHLLAGW